MRSVFARAVSVRIGAGALAFALAAVFPRISDAESASPAGELTLAQAITQALTRNPDLAASAYELATADARIAQARLRPNPELSVDLENFAGSGVARGTRALETTLSLSQVVELGGQRALRVDVASADRDLAGVEREARQLDVLSEVTRRFIQLVAAQDRLSLAGTTKQVAERTLEAISARVNAARSPEAERSRARIALTRALLEEAQLRSEERSARYSLAALWGGAEPTFGVARADLQRLDTLQPFETLVARLERNPDFVRFASETRLRDAELALARAQARPNLVFGVGVRRFSETSDNALVASVSMPLTLFDRNQGAIREAGARRAQTNAARDAAFVRARATVYGLYQELLASRMRVETLRAEALPLSDRALEETQYGYQRGRFSYLELATAQQEQLSLRAALIEAAADYHRILVEIERLTGEPVSVAAS